MTVIHEQNAVIGRANRAVAHGATAIATSFPKVERLTPALAAKATMTGNPVRASVLAARHRPYTAPGADEPFNLLVFGGSQGARYFAELMPEVIGHLPHAVRRTLTVVQQCREEDMKSVRAEYERLNVKVQLAPFFADLPERIAAAHLVMARSGASTVAELSAHRPAGGAGAAAAFAGQRPAEECRKLCRRRRRLDPPSRGRSSPPTSRRFSPICAMPRKISRPMPPRPVAGARPDAAERLADLVERSASVSGTTATGDATEPAATLERTDP